MSKVFDALRKQNVLDVDDMSSLDIADSKQQARSSPDVATTVVPLSCHRNTTRLVRLRISALSPVLPFDRKQQLLASDQYRIIRTKILHRPDKPQFVLVSSGAKGDGKTVTSINLAGSFALKEDARVLLLDGDLRQSQIAQSLGVAETPGLVDVLSGRIDLKSALVRAEQFPNLFILTAGHGAQRAEELLESVRWRALIRQIRANFSTVVCDGPPIATVADYELLELASDGVVVVARPDHTDRAICMAALRAVRQQKLLGVVLNGVENWCFWKAPVYGYQIKEAANREPQCRLQRSRDARGEKREGEETDVREP